MGSYVFKPTQKESDKIDFWLKNHKCPLLKVSLKKRASINYTISFTPTGLGDVVEVSCDCKKKCDVTEYEGW
jgi:hypothetical protein